MAEGVRSFQVSTRRSGRRRVVKVKVYDDLDLLRSDADRRDDRPGWFDQALGVAHGWEPAPGGTHAGLIRLWRGALTNEVVTHEAAHMANLIYRQDHKPAHGSIDDGMDNEEVLCHLVGHLTGRIVDRLYNLGYYSEA